MRKLLKEISAIPGVTGTCIFDKQEGMVCLEAEADLVRNLTEKVGIHFVRLLQMGDMNKLNIASAHFRFDRYAVLAMPLEKGAILLTVCDANANCSLVAATAAMLAHDMSSDPAQPAVPAAKEQRPREEKAATDARKSALQAQLAEIEDALAGAIGPVAGVVLNDYFARWCQNGPVEAGRLPELLNLLAGEIGDAKLIAEFRKQLKSKL